MNTNTNNMPDILKTKRNFKRIRNRIIIGGAAILVIAIIAALALSHFNSESKTTKIGFEDIGVLDTQVAYCTVVDVIDDPRKIFNIDIPFTKSKYIYIYSYDVEVKAGLDFSKIKYDIGDNKIKVTAPEPYITNQGKGIVEDSLKVYLEDESIFSPVTMEEQSEARSELVKQAEKDAISNGILDKAKANAEILLANFFKQSEQYTGQEIVFNWKEEI